MLTPSTEGRGDGPSPTILAALLAAGLLALVVILSLVATDEAAIDLGRLERLVDAGQVIRIEVGPAGLRADLAGPAVLDEGGIRRRVRAVVVAGPIDAGTRAALDRWSAAGVPVTEGSDTRAVGWRHDLWALVLVGLLGLGLAHLVVQGRRYRREGSPRERLEQARQDLDAGRITPDEFERRAAALTIEM